MRTKIVIGVALFLIALMPGAPASSQATPSTSSETDEPAQASVLEAYTRLPMLFIHNQGQVDSQVEYYVKTPGQTVYLTPSSMVFDLVRYHNTETTDAAERLAFSLDFLNANTSPLIAGSNKDEAVVNYLIGNDPQKWHTDIPTYREVTYQDVYPGIDLRLYGKKGYLEYEFIVQPGANVSDIALAYNGVEGLYMDSGELVVSTAFGDLNQSQPYIYQPMGDDTVAVKGGFRLLGSKSYGFEVGNYDAGYPLVIDPSLHLAYSTYLGGSGADIGYGIAVEAGCAYVTGGTDSTNFPTKNWYHQDYSDSTTDAFVAKLDTTKSGNASLIYSTYLGGSALDTGSDIAVWSGYAYVTGNTWSANFPTSATAYQTNQGGGDAFVTKLNPEGDALVYSTYLGGNDTDEGEGIAVEGGDAYVTGYTASTDFPTLNDYQDDPGDGAWDAFVTQVTPTGDNITYSTYLGGNGRDRGYGIAAELGYAYVTGWTESTDFPTTLNAYQTDPGDATWDAFVAKIYTALSDNASLIYSTYLGGSGAEAGYDIAVESGYAYIIGYTSSVDFPTQNPYQTNQIGDDAFVTKLNTTGDNITYSTYLGGSSTDNGYGIAVESGCAYIVGDTASTNFPTQNPYQTDQTGTDAFVAKLNTTGDNIIYSTYLGGSDTDRGYGIAVESACAYVIGQTASTNFPTTPSRYQSDPSDTNTDAFVTKFGDPDAVDKVGIWRGNTRYFYLDMDGDVIYDGSSAERFGTFLSSTQVNDVPIAGDWNSDNTDEVGVWRGATRYFYLDMDGDGIYDGTATERFGTFLSSTDATDRPVAGDWDGDGKDEVGIWRGANRYFYLDVNGNGIYNGTATERFGPFLSSTDSTDRPIAGDWDEDGTDEIGVWRGATRYFYLDMDGDGIYDGTATERFGPFLSSTDATDRPVAGDWDGDGTDEIGVWRGNTRYFYLDMNGDGIYDGTAERFGPFLSSTDASDVPVAGNW